MHLSRRDPSIYQDVMRRAAFTREAPIRPRFSDCAPLTPLAHADLNYSNPINTSLKKYPEPAQPLKKRRTYPQHYSGAKTFYPEPKQTLNKNQQTGNDLSAGL